MSEIKKGVLKDFNDNSLFPYTTQDQVEGLETALSNKQDKIDAEHKLSSDLIEGEIGTKVEANPEDEATESLSKIKIGEDVFNIEAGGTVVSGEHDESNWTSLTIGDDTYDIPQGSDIDVSGECFPESSEESDKWWKNITIGDTTASLSKVRANLVDEPTEEPTETLTTLEVDNVLYKIPQGGEGSDSNYTLDFECTPYLLGHKIVNSTNKNYSKSILVNTDVSVDKVQKILMRLCDTLAESETSYIAGIEPDPSTPEWTRKIIVNKPNVEFRIEGLYGIDRPNRDLSVRSSGYSILLASDSEYWRVGDREYYHIKVVFFVSGNTTITKINDVEADPIILTEPGWYECYYDELPVTELSEPVDFEITNITNSGIYELYLHYHHLSVSSTSLEYNELLREFLNWHDSKDSSTAKFEYVVPKSKLTLLNNGIEKNSISLEELQDNLTLKQDAINGIKTVSKTVLKPLRWDMQTNRITLRHLDGYHWTDEYTMIHNTLANAVWPDDDIVFNDSYGSLEIHINQQPVLTTTSNSDNKWLRIQFITKESLSKAIYYYSLSDTSFYINISEGFSEEVKESFLARCSSDVNLEFNYSINFGNSDNWYITNEVKEALSYLFGHENNRSYINKNMISLTTEKGTLDEGVEVNNPVKIVSNNYYLQQTPVELRLDPNALINLFLKAGMELPNGFVWDAPSSSLSVCVTSNLEIDDTRFDEVIAVSYVDKLTPDNSIIVAMLNPTSWYKLSDLTEIDVKSFSIQVANGGEATTISGEINKAVSVILADSISSPKGQQLFTDRSSYGIPSIKGKPIFIDNGVVVDNIAVPDSLAYLTKKLPSDGRLPNVNDAITKVYGGSVKNNDLILDVLKDVPSDNGNKFIKLFATDEFEFWLDYQDGSSMGMEGYFIYLSDGDEQFMDIAYISSETITNILGVENNTWYKNMSSGDIVKLPDNFNLLSVFGYDGSQEFTVTEVADEIDAFTGLISIEPFEGKIVKGLGLTDEGVPTQSNLIQIKTINGQEIIGEGDIHIEGGSFPSTSDLDPSKTYNLQYVDGQMVWNEATAGVDLPPAEDESFGDDEVEE